MTGATSPWTPRTCVWELTLACNAACIHCGSTAGERRPDELSTAEALALVAELAALGCETVTFSGGEPLLRDDWPELARAVRQAGMQLELITNGLAVAAQADAIAAAGFFAVTVSIDGPAEIHDRLRGLPGACERLLTGVAALVHRGVRVGAVTQVSKPNLSRLSEVHELLLEHGIAGWQVQLTMPHGRAADRVRELCLEPTELPGLARQMLDLYSSTPLFVQVADNIGYMSRAEPRLRAGTGSSAASFWTGCQAGLEVVGITSDGTVRGCLSLPPAADEGSLRERSLSAIWHDPASFAANRKFRPELLHGPCADCPFGRVCRGGCRSLAYATSGDPHANSHCLWRIERQERGER